MAFQVRKNRKFKFLPQVVQFIFILCGAGFKCSYESVSLGCRVTGITQFVFCASNVRLCFLLTRNSGNSTELTRLFLGHFLRCARSTSPLLRGAGGGKPRPSTRSAGQSAQGGPWALAVGGGWPPGAGSARICSGSELLPLPSLSLTGFTYAPLSHQT